MTIGYVDHAVRVRADHDVPTELQGRARLLHLVAGLEV